MQCSKCTRDSLIFQPYSGMHLCRNHFLLDVETKAKRDIRAHHWLRPGDHIGVLLTGDKKSPALLHLLAGLVANRRDVRVTALFMGNPGEGAHTARDLQRFVEDHGIDCLYEAAGDVDSQTGALTRASPSLKEIAGRHGITKIAIGRCLDDTARVFLVSILKGNPERFFWNEKGTLLPVITPFISVPGSEVDLYTDVIAGGRIGPYQKAPAGENFERGVGDVLDTYTERHPATKYSLVQISERIRTAKNGCGMRDLLRNRHEKISRNLPDLRKQKPGGDHK